MSLRDKLLGEIASFKEWYEETKPTTRQMREQIEKLRDGDESLALTIQINSKIKAIQKQLQEQVEK